MSRNLHQSLRRLMMTAKGAHAHHLLGSNSSRSLGQRYYLSRVQCNHELRFVQAINVQQCTEGSTRRLDIA
jgi:hypothetical protein